MRLLTAQFNVNTMMVDNIVAMHAPRRRLQVGGAVEMADTQRSQVIDDSGRGLEAETGV
jgi:hypothetical protein